MDIDFDSILMNFKIDSDSAGEQIDELSNKLIDQFENHFKQFDAQYPNSNKRLVYEGWAIQKIAALQYMVLLQQAQINTLSFLLDSDSEEEDEPEEDI